MLGSQNTVIFYDVDGTLAKPFESINPQIKKIISSMDKFGVKQVLCSGKGKDYLAGMARGIGINSTSHVIAENGGIIYDWRNQIVKKISQDSFDKAKEIKPRVYQLLKQYDFFEEAKENIITLFFKEIDRLPEISEYLKANLKMKGMQIKHYSDGALDIIFGDHHKGMAINSLLKKEYQNTQVFTFGDGLNDLEMLSIGHPVTFSSAHPEVVKQVKQRGGTVAKGEGPESILCALSSIIFKNQIHEAINHVDYINRDWGNWEVLSRGKNYKVKRMVVSPGAKLSLQRHNHRSEHWFVFEGCAEIIINNKKIEISEGEDYFVPQQSIHQIINPGLGDLVIIEVQRGKYLGEDDIVRFE